MTYIEFGIFIHLRQVYRPDDVVYLFDRQDIGQIERQLGLFELLGRVYLEQTVDDAKTIKRFYTRNHTCSRPLRYAYVRKLYNEVFEVCQSSLSVVDTDTVQVFGQRMQVSYVGNNSVFGHRFLHCQKNPIVILYVFTYCCHIDTLLFVLQK